MERAQPPVAQAAAVVPNAYCSESLTTTAVRDDLEMSNARIFKQSRCGDHWLALDSHEFLVEDIDNYFPSITARPPGVSPVRDCATCDRLLLLVNRATIGYRYLESAWGLEGLLL